MSSRTKFSYSYGLIVKTACNKIVVIKRKVPYCVQNFYCFLHQNNFPYKWTDLNPFPNIQEDFEIWWLPRLKEHDHKDYRLFKKGKVFEDMIDFPHGQYFKKNKNIYKIFLSAYREFQEESGFRFSFTKEDVNNFPLINLNFIGCDGHLYTQYYFIVENVKGLRRFRYFDSFNEMPKSTIKAKSWIDDRFVFEGKLISCKAAYLIFKNQQKIKKDNKHLLIMNKENIFQKKET